MSYNLHDAMDIAFVKKWRGSIFTRTIEHKYHGKSPVSRAERHSLYDERLSGTLDGGERRQLPDPALSASRLALRNADVSVLTEDCAPTVFHFPIRLAIVDAIANGKNTMIKAGSASIVGEHPTRVMLEDGFVRLDGD